MKREIAVPELFEACQKHPEKAEIFWLEQMLVQAGYPHCFNLREDLRPVFGEPEGDPESIDWDTYPFLIEIGDPVRPGLAEISVCFNEQGDRTLLELLEAKSFSERDNELHADLTAEQAMEIIRKIF